MKKQTAKKKIDVFLLGIVALLVFLGLFILYDASSFIAFRDFGDKYHYIKEQLTWAVVGFVCMTILAFTDYRKLYNLALPGLICSLVLLVMVFIPHIGVSLLGARRWIDLQFFLLQPSELTKVSLALYLAAWFSRKERGRLLSFFLLLGLVIFLIILQPDMGTAAIILAEALVVYFLSGGSVKSFLTVVPIIAVIAFGLILIEPYRAARLATYLNPDSSLQTSSYHVRQILIALGSGGFNGVGLGNSMQKFAYLPENATDSIFAIAAEEFGFVGSVILIGLFITFIWRGFLIASNAKDTFGKLFAGAIISFLATQIIVNLSAMTLLIPLTGIPLPFISYGGSALIINLSAVGILLSISRVSEQKTV